MIDVEAAARHEQGIQDLEGLVEQLLARCRHLEDENAALQRQQVALVAERAILLERQGLARERVAAVISRLKALEHP
jgi:cell division protein ZapB